jgi:hypothetical protein
MKSNSTACIYDIYENKTWRPLGNYAAPAARCSTGLFSRKLSREASGPPTKAFDYFHRLRVKADPVIL